MARARSNWVDALASGASPEPEVSGWEAASAWLRGEANLTEVPEALALAAVEAAALRQDVERLQAAEGESKAVRKAARAAMHRLRSQGVRVAEPAPRQAGLTAPDERLPSRAFLGWPDARGGFLFFGNVSEPEGRHLWLLGRIGTHGGLDDIRLLDLTRSGVRAFWRDLEEAVDTVEVPLVTMLHVLLPALDLEVERQGGPPDAWLTFAGALGRPTIDAARINDPLRYRARTLGDAPLPSADALLELPQFAPWRLVDPNPVYETFQALALTQEEASPDSVKNLVDGLLERVDAVYTPPNRAQAARMLRLVALLAGETEAGRLALGYAGMIEAGRPASEIPLLATVMTLTLIQGTQDTVDGELASAGDAEDSA